MKAEDTLLFIIVITQNPILAKTAWFWHAASHMLSGLSQLGKIFLQILETMQQEFCI